MNVTLALHGFGFRKRRNTERADAPVRGTHQGHVAAIIFTELTVNVAFSCVDEPIADLNESLLFNFVSRDMNTPVLEALMRG